MKPPRSAITVVVAALLAVSLQAAGGVDLSGMADEPFLKEHWPQARALVWAKPGTSGPAMSGGSWTEYASTADYLANKEGRPATRRPDKNTDIILPDAPDGEPYIVGYIVEARKRVGGFDRPQWSCRHITIGSGAGLDGGCNISRGRPAFSRSPSFDTGMGIYGNVKVRDGGYIYGQHTFLGDRHTYFSIGDSPEPLGKLWIIRKAKNASLTLLSKQYELAKGITVESGRLVLDSNCQLRFGAGHEARIAVKKLQRAGAINRESYVYVHKDAALEMRAGSRIGRAVEPQNTVADVRIEGLLQIGRPGGANDGPAVIELGMAEGDGGFLQQHGGLYIRDAAEVKNFGKLAITANRRDAAATANKGVSVFLAKAVDLGDVSFDYLRPGGIAAKGAEMGKSAVAGATFGPHCAATGDELFSTFYFIDFQGGMGTVEFVDGLKTDCKILFPHAGRLMVRGKGYRTLQSFDLKSVHAVTINGKRTEFNAKRPLNDGEKQLREMNALWGDVVGKGQVGDYADQEWPECPVMIWAHPGVSGARFAGPNWLDENGTPYFEVPLISQRVVRSDNPPIDVLMPASNTRYEATGWGTCSSEGAPPHRHLTIEYNASYGKTYNVQGNLWMKHGSGLSGWHRGRFDNRTPNLHRFLRFDGLRVPYRRGDINAPLVESRYAVLGQWGHFVTGDGATLELIGRIQVAADRLYIDGTGRLIVSEGGELADGSRSGMWVMPGATLVLLQDAVVGTEITQQHPQCYASIMVSGALMIGLPDKPIRRDMAFALSGVRKDSINRAPPVDMRSAGSSFVLSEPGRFEVHSADPQRARVIFKMHDSERARKAGAKFTRDGKPDGIALYFAGKADLDGVVFDNVVEGGIMVSPRQRATWKNIFYGPRNLAEPEKLYWKLETPK